MMSGGDVVPLGKNAVSELHALFDWARASPHGVLLLIDQADASLRHVLTLGLGLGLRLTLALTPTQGTPQPPGSPRTRLPLSLALSLTQSQ